MSNGSFTVVNNFISSNGAAGSTVGGVSIQSISPAGTHVFDFNSISHNVAASAATSGVDCVLVRTSLTLSNSIVYGTGKQVGGLKAA